MLEQHKSRIKGFFYVVSCIGNVRFVICSVSLFTESAISIFITIYHVDLIVRIVVTNAIFKIEAANILLFHELP